MHKAVVGGIVVTGCLALLVAEASGKEAGTGLELGLRTGYAHAMGKVTDQGTNPNMSNFVTGNVPLWFDLGYRVTPNVLIGGYFQYGFGFPGDLADGCGESGVSCSLPVVRLGAQVHYHVQPFEVVDPWFGLGFGYEWATLSATEANTSGSLGVSGFEFVNLQAGISFGLGDAKKFALGPFVAFSLAQYSSVSCGGILAGRCPEDVDEKALHEWLTFGVRGTFVD
jgi:hypothetical protein